MCISRAEFLRHHKSVSDPDKASTSKVKHWRWNKNGLKSLNKQLKSFEDASRSRLSKSILLRVHRWRICWHISPPAQHIVSSKCHLPFYEPNAASPALRSMAHISRNECQFEWLCNRNAPRTSQGGKLISRFNGRSCLQYGVIGVYSLM